MRPTQLVRQRRTYWVAEVELANPNEIASAEPLAVAEGEIAAKGGKKGGAVLGPDLAALLELHDVVADLPVGLGQLGVDGPVGPHLPLGVNFGDAAQQPLVFGIGGQFAHFDSPPIIVRMRSVTPFNSASISARSRGGLKT